MLKARSPKSKKQQDCILVVSFRGEFILYFIQLLVAAGILCFVAASSSLCLLDHMLTPLPSLPKPLSLPLIRTLVITFRTHPDNPGRSSHLNIIKLITTARPFLSEITFTGSGYEGLISWGHDLVYYKL